MLPDLWPKTPGAAAGSAWAARLTNVHTLRFTGPDVLSFMQGYLTTDPVRLPGDGSFRLTAMTNLKGRVVASGWCARSDATRLDWVVHESLAARALEFLKPYLAFAKTDACVVPAEEEIVVGLLVKDAPSVTRLEDAAALSSFLAEHSVVDEARWRRSCIDAGVVLVTDAITEEFLPQMLGLVVAGAVEFDKGCYLGQEVVARAQHRGNVKRALVRLEAPARSLPAVGTVLRDDASAAAGWVVATTTSGDLDDGHVPLLAVVRTPPAASYFFDGVELLSAGA